MTPWELAKESEHSHQRALFAFLNKAAVFGFNGASDPACYDKIKRDALITMGFQYVPVPELAFAYAIHNQGHGDQIRGNRAKAEGVKSGAPDLCLPVVRTFPSPPPLRSVMVYHGFYIEMKKPSQKPKRSGAGGVREVQSEFMAFLAGQGYAVMVCYSWQEAANAIAEYMGSAIRVKETS